MLPGVLKAPNDQFDVLLSSSFDSYFHCLVQTSCDKYNAKHVHIHAHHAPHTIDKAQQDTIEGAPTGLDVGPIKNHQGQ